VASGYPSYPGDVIVVDNVAEVFDRPMVTAPK
jgi:hypothetical protein